MLFAGSIIQIDLMAVCFSIFIQIKSSVVVSNDQFSPRNFELSVYGLEHENQIRAFNSHGYMIQTSSEDSIYSDTRSISMKISSE